MAKDKDLAIAYSIKRRNKGGMIQGASIRKNPQDIARAIIEKMAMGGMVEEEFDEPNDLDDDDCCDDGYAEGGEVKKKKPLAGLLERIRSKHSGV